MDEESLVPYRKWDFLVIHLAFNLAWSPYFQINTYMKTVFFYSLIVSTSPRFLKIEDTKTEQQQQNHPKLTFGGQDLIYVL